MRFTLIFKTLVVVFFSTFEVSAQNSAMTYNIRYATERDGINRWENRKDWVSSLINFYEPDVLGIQEGLHRQVAFLDSALENYSYVGVGRDDAKEAGEYAAIFYKIDKLEVIDSGTFWLSETPDLPSYGWGANYRRITTWAKFRIKETDDEYWVFNAHFDHEVAQARLNSSKLITNRLEEWNTENEPVLVMGDFNATPEAPPIEHFYKKFKDSKLESLEIPIGPNGTYNGFDTSHPLDRRIDYIFVDHNIIVEKYAVLSETKERRTPSDHLPVFIKFALR